MMEGLYSNHLLIKLFLSLIKISVFLHPCLAAQTSTEFIRTSCGETTYPKLCFASLSTHANQIQTSPKLLAHVALNITLSSAKSTSSFIVKLSGTRGMGSREMAAMRDCKEVTGNAVNELKRSITRMGEIDRSNYDLAVSDIQTWVSAAMTDESTCLDGFEEEEMNGNVKSMVKVRITNVVQLTSNALALFNKYASHNKA